MEASYGSRTRIQVRVMTSGLSKLEGTLKDMGCISQPDLTPLQLLYLAPFLFSHMSSSRDRSLKDVVSWSVALCILEPILRPSPALT